MSRPACIVGAWLVALMPIHSAETVRAVFADDGSRLEIFTRAAAEPALQLRVALPAAPPLLGRVARQGDRLVFEPALPFLPGQRYDAVWRAADGRMERAEWRMTAPSAVVPEVQLLPQSPLPANALKVYLHFSEPMEQGVFLDRLRLWDVQKDREVTGPFRETELWSLDGRRLTVWFHPGRQKTGVNLNEEEGPVLRPGQRYELVLAGTWRSTRGVALGREVRLPLSTVPVDHKCPQLTRWRVKPPAVGGQQPLRVQFDEALDVAMLSDALSVDHRGVPLELTVTVDPSGREWSAVPKHEWQAGDYELRANPDLEDLAGNSLVKPFEVDLNAPPPRPAETVLRFTLSAPESSSY